MADEIRIPISADTTRMESQIANAAQKATVVIRPTVDSRGIEGISRPLGKITGQADEFSKSMEAANARVLAFGASVGVLNAVANAFKNIVTSSAEVEASLKEIQVASNATTNNLDKLGKGIFDVAKATGLSFKQAADATLEFARQGGELESSLNRAKAALVLTRTTGLDAAESVRGLTAAVQSFNEVGLDYETVVNKLASVDTKFAVSSRDLIEGISRSASVAQEAGVSFDELTALITTLQEKTARGGAVIGNALKTIFTRIQNSENLDLLRQMGIAVNDVSGNILPATTLIKKLADEFDNLDSVTRKSVLTKIGGGFQIDKLAAVLNDVAKSTGTFQRSLEASQNAGTQAFDKLDQLNKTTLASFDRLKSSGMELASTIGKIAFADEFKTMLNKTSSFLETLNESISGGEDGGASVGKAIVKGIGSAITGPGALLVGALVTKLLIDLGKFSFESIKNQLGINNSKKEQRDIEKSIFDLLNQNRTVQQNILSLEGNKAAQAEYLLGIYNQQAQVLSKMSQISKEISPAVYEGGIRFSEKGVKNIKNAASGYSPKEMAAYNDEKRNAPAGAKIIKDDNFPFGGGVRGTMFYNSQETRIKNYANGGDAIIPNYAVPNENIQKPTFVVDAGKYSIAGLTIGGKSTNLTARGNEINSRILEKAVSDPTLQSAFSKYGKIRVDNVNVGNVYRKKDEYLDSLAASEDDIKNHFIKKANDFLSPRIGEFVKEELSSVGIKPTKAMEMALQNNQKFDFVNSSMAGKFFETMLKAANMGWGSEDWGKFVSGGDTNFDIYNLRSEIAKQYGLPEKPWKYVEVKASEDQLKKDVTRKFINEMIQGNGSADLKEKFLAESSTIKTAASGYIPLSRKVSDFPKLENRSRADAKDEFSAEIVPKYQAKTIKQYNAEATKIAQSILPHYSKSKGKELNSDNLNNFLGSLEQSGVNQGTISSLRNLFINADPNKNGFINFINQIKGVLGEVDASKESKSNLTDFGSYFDLQNGDEVRTRKEVSTVDILRKGINNYLKNHNIAQGNKDEVSLGKIGLWLPQGSHLIKSAAKGYSPKISISEGIEEGGWGDPKISAKIGDKEVGYLTYLLGEGKDAEIGNLEVDKKLRGQGISGELYKTLHNKLKGYEISGTLLHQGLHEGSDFSYPQLSRALYAKNGWKVQYRDPVTKDYITKTGKQKDARKMVDSLRGLSAKFPKSDLMLDLITYAAKGYVPNFANIQSLSGPVSKWNMSYAGMSEEDVKSSFSGQQGTNLRGTTTGIRSQFGGKFELLENNIIASILGNNTFFSPKQEDREGLERFANQLSAQGSSSSVGIMGLSKYNTKDDEVISGLISGNFRNLKYEKLKDIFPRLWRAKGVGGIWEQVKKELLEREDSPYSRINLVEPTKILRDTAIQAATKYNNISGFNIDLTGSADKQLLDKKISSNVSYLTPFTGSGITDFKNLGVEKAKRKASLDEYKKQQEIESYRTNGILYKDFKKQESQLLKLGRWGNYDSKNKLIYLLNAAGGYVPNFAKNGALMDAISREQKESGLPLSAIKVVQDSRLMGRRNPDGLAVINNRDEPDGKIPNFADGGSSDLLKAVVQEVSTQVKEFGKNLNEVINEVSKNTGIAATEIQKAYGQLNSASSTIAGELKNATAKATGKIPSLSEDSWQKMSSGGLIQTNYKKSNEDKAVEKSLGDTAGKLILFQTAISFVSGAIGSMGEGAQKVAGILQDAASVGYLISQGKDIKEQLQKTAEKGGTLGNVAGVASKAVMPLAIAYGVFKGADIVNTLIKQYGDTADKTADAVGRLNEIQKKYTVQLTDEQKTKSESFTKKIGNVEASTAFDRFFERISNFSGPTKTREKLTDLGFEGAVNSPLVNMISQMTTPQAQEIFLKQTGPIKDRKKLSDIQDQLSSDLIEEIKRQSSDVKENIVVQQGANYQVTSSIQKEYTLKPEEFFKNLEQRFAEAQKKNAVPAVMAKLIQESFLIPAQLLKTQIDVMGELQKTYASLTTSAENELDIRRQLLSTSESEKQNLEFQLKIKQAEKQSNINSASTSFDFAKQAINKVIDLRGTAVDEQFAKDTQERFQKLAGGLFSGRTSQQDMQKAIEEEIQKSKGISTGIGDNDKQKKLQEYIDFLKKEAQINKLNLDLENAKLQVQKQEIAQQNLNNAVIQQQNFYYQAQKDFINARLTVAQQALDKEKERIGYLRQIQDYETEINRLGKDTPGDLAKQKLEDIQKEKERTIEDLKKNAQENLLRNKVTVSDRLKQNQETIGLAEQALKAKSNKELIELGKQGLLQGQTSIEKRLTDAGEEFYKIVSNAADKVANSLTPRGEKTGVAGVSEQQKAENLLKNSNLTDAAKYVEAKKIIEKTKGPEVLEDLPFEEGTLIQLEDFVKKFDQDTEKRKEYYKKLVEDANLVAAQFGMIPAQDAETGIEAAEKKAKVGTATVLESERQRLQFRTGVEKSTKQMGIDLEEFNNALGKEIPNAFRDSMLSAMKDIASGTKGIKSSLLSAAGSFLQAINNAFMTRTANSITTGLFGNGRTGEEGLLSGLFHSSGGMISGGSGARDDVPAMLMGGEYVINKKAVAKYGSSFFDKLNSGKLKGYASGGLIPSQELDVNDYARNKSNYVAYGTKRDNGIYFDDAGNATNIDNYTGTEENKANAIKKAQSDYYLANAQSGVGGFNLPGVGGAGAIVGQQSLLSFATQQLMPNQENLSLFALRDQGNSKIAEIQQAKEKAMEIYFGGTQASKEKAVMQEEIRKQIEEAEKQKKKQEKQAVQGMIVGALINIGSSLAMAGIGQMMKGGEQAGIANAANANNTAIQEQLSSQYSSLDAAGASPQAYSEAYANTMKEWGLGEGNKWFDVSNTKLSPWQKLGAGIKGIFSPSTWGGSKTTTDSQGNEYTWKNGGWELNASPKPNPIQNAAKISQNQSVQPASSFRNSYVPTTRGSYNLENYFDNMRAPSMEIPQLPEDTIPSKSQNTLFDDLPPLPPPPPGQEDKDLNLKSSFIRYGNPSPIAAMQQQPSWYWSSTMDKQKRVAAAGGYVAGNGKGDNVPTMLNGGEFVVSRQAAEKVGYGNLQKLNSAGDSGISEQLISRLESKFDELIEKGGGTGTINIEVNSNGESKESEDNTSENKDQRNKELARKIKDVVLSVLREEKRLGGMLRQ